MKLALILYAKNSNNKNSFKKLKKGFEELYVYSEKKGVKFCRAPIAYYDNKKDIFKKAHFFENGQWTWKKNITPDTVYDKSPFYISRELRLIRKVISKKHPFLNDLRLSEILSNKWLTYKSFKEFSPQTFLVKNARDLKKINKLNTEKIILKPITGSGGRGIEITERGKTVIKDFPFLAQELIFVAPKNRGLAQGPHDLRINIRNEEPVYAYLRIPPDGKLIANLSQGARIQVVGLNNLPQETNEVVAYASKKLKKFSQKLYSIDIIFDMDQKPWILEMNSRPGITLEKEEKEKGTILWDNLIEMLKNS